MIILANTRTVTGVRGGTVVVGGITAGGTRRQVRMGTGPAAAHIIRTLIPIVRTNRAVRDVGMGADTGATHVIGAFVSVVRAGDTVGLMIRLTGTRPVASIRVGAVIERRITAGRASRVVRMRADAATAQVIRTFITFVRTRGAVR